MYTATVNKFLRIKKEYFGRHGIWYIFCSGVLLRLIYILKTPHNVRAHDIRAHIDYIRYIVTNMSIPPANAGWEFHQPPLFYGISALIWKISIFFGLTDNQIISVLQGFSFLLSVLIVQLAIWLVILLFEKKIKSGHIIFILIISIFPGLILATSRISNDLLSYVFAFAAIALFFSWQKTNDIRKWYALSIVLAAGILTKMTILPLAAACFMSAICVKRNRKMMKHVLLSVICITVLVGWFPLLRMTEPNPRNLIPQTEGLSEGVLLPNTPQNFLVFNPIAFVPIAYLDPWQDSSRRQYYFEYLYRSAFLGEWNFGKSHHLLSSSLLVLGLGLLFLAIIGLYKSLRNRTYWCLPMIIIFCSLLLGAIIFRINNTCSCSQDFRFIPAILAPISAWIAYATISLKSNRLRQLIFTWMIVFAGFSFLFFITLKNAR